MESITTGDPLSLADFLSRFRGAVHPGPGGWAAFLQLQRGNDTIEKMVTGEEHAVTTNNAMEIQAVVGGLRALNRPCQVTLRIDSTYVIKGIERILAGQPLQRGIKNDDRWTQLADQLRGHLTIRIRINLAFSLGQPSQHDANRCKVDHTFTYFWMVFIIFTQAAKMIVPTKCPFHNPSEWDDFKSNGTFTSLRHFNHPSTNPCQTAVGSVISKT